jgi:hypothetical protein
MGILQEVESVMFYETAATGAGRLYRFETVLSTVNLVWLRVARKSYQRYGFGSQSRCPYQGIGGERERRIRALVTSTFIPQIDTEVKPLMGIWVKKTSST